MNIISKSDLDTMRQQCHKRIEQSRTVGGLDAHFRAVERMEEMGRAYMRVLRLNGGRRNATKGEQKGKGVSMSKEQVGIIGVDAGMVMVGDPCYFWPDGEGRSAHTDAIPTWAELCHKTGPCNTQLNYAKGHAGLGVVVSTTHGDGTYPVYIVTTAKGKRRLVVELD